MNELTGLHGDLQRDQPRVLETGACYPLELTFNVAIRQGPTKPGSFIRAEPNTHEYGESSTTGVPTGTWRTVRARTIQIGK